MELTTIRELFKDRESYLGKKVTIGGWVRSLRDSKTFGFIVVNDGSYFEPLQIVYHDEMENFAEVSKLNVGAAIIVKGTLVATPQAKQPFEIQADEVQIEGASASDYPLQKKRHSLEYLRTISHLRPRTNTFQAVFRVRSLCAYAIHKFFQEQGFVYVHTPLITGSDCEGAGEMFQVTTMDLNNVPKTEEGKVDYTEDFFGKPTNLTVSGQLNGETYAMAFKKIYTFGPTFRAENSNTTRHAAEFWMIEPEIAFADLQDDMELAEDMLKYVIKYVMDECPEEMQFFNQFVEKGLLDNTVVVIYGDHDARLPKKDYNRLYNYDKTTDSVKDEDSEGYVNFDSYQYELNRKVPFIIWTKDKKYNVEVKNVMGMYDAMPTLGNMLGFSNKYALGHDIFNIKENNIVVFPNGNWVTNKVYYNAQKGQYLSLNNNEIIDKNYISENTKYAEDLLSVSNDMIVFDLVKKENEKEQASSSK